MLCSRSLADFAICRNAYAECEKHRIGPIMDAVLASTVTLESNQSTAAAAATKTCLKTCLLHQSKATFTANYQQKQQGTMSKTLHRSLEAKLAALDGELLVFSAWVEFPAHLASGDSFFSFFFRSFLNPHSSHPLSPSLLSTHPPRSRVG